MGGAIECRVSNLKKTDYFKLKSTQQLHDRPFVHSNNSIVVLKNWTKNGVGSLSLMFSGGLNRRRSA
jgi:hypothetical protein